MPDENNCPHTDADHEAAQAHAITSFVTFNRVAKERGLCMGACHAALMVELVEEIASHTEGPADFLEIIVDTIHVATGLRMTNVTGVVDCPVEVVKH